MRPACQRDAMAQLHANLYFVTYRWSQVPLHCSDWRPELRDSPCRVTCLSFHELGAVLRGTANLPTTPWIWTIHDATSRPFRAISHTPPCFGVSFAYLLIDSQCSGANWLYLSRHGIPLIQQTSMTHPNFDLHHLLIDLQEQMHSCIRNF